MLLEKNEILASNKMRCLNRRSVEVTPLSFGAFCYLMRKVQSENITLNNWRQLNWIKVGQNQNQNQNQESRIKNQESRSILNLISIGNRISVDQTIRTASLDSCPQKPTSNKTATKLRMSRKKKLAEEKLW